MAWLAAQWAKFQNVLVFLGSILAGLAFVFFQGKSAGREQAEKKQREVDDAARKRMDSVKPSNPGDVINSLRKGDF